MANSKEFMSFQPEDDFDWEEFWEGEDKIRKAMPDMMKRGKWRTKLDVDNNHRVVGVHIIDVATGEPILYRNREFDRSVGDAADI